MRVLRVEGEGAVTVAARPERSVTVGWEPAETFRRTGHYPVLGWRGDPCGRAGERPGGPVRRPPRRGHFALPVQPEWFARWDHVGHDARRPLHGVDAAHGACASHRADELASRRLGRGQPVDAGVPQCAAVVGVNAGRSAKGAPDGEVTLKNKCRPRAAFVVGDRDCQPALRPALSVRHRVVTESSPLRADSVQTLAAFPVASAARFGP